MNVRMPDGTIIANVPEGTTQTELLSRYQAHQEVQSGGAGRKLALAGRAVGEGVLGTLGGIAESAGKAVTGGSVHDAVLEHYTGKNAMQHDIASFNAHFGTDIPEAKSIPELLSAVLTKFGAPTPETSGEKLGYAATAGAAGALAGGGAAGLVRGVPAALSVATSGGLGGAAPEAVRQAGGGEGAQTAAGVAAALLPTGTRAGLSGAAKYTMRGGEAGRVRAAENIRSFEAAGASPSMGQATQNRRLQGAESLLSRTPGAAGRMASTAEAQAKDLGAGIERQAAQLASKSSGEQAGRAIERGVSGSGGFLEKFEAQSQKLYDDLDRFVAADTPVAVSNTQQTLADLTRITPGAAATSKRLINPRIASIAEDLKTDAASGTLPYAALKDIRSRIGAEAAGGALKSDVPTAELKRLYGALSKDMEAAAKAAGPQAERAYTRATNYYRAGSRRIETLQSVIDRNGGHEMIFKAATSGTKEGATTLRAVMQSLPQDAQKMVTATVLRRLGRAKPGVSGVQDELGEFSSETFLTNWNTMSNEAKATLFNRYGPSFRQDMDKVAQVAANLRQGSKVFRNPSGTSQALAQNTAVGGIVVALGTGQFGVAGGIVGGMVGANLSARLLTNPRAVRWLASHTKAPVAAYPALVNQLMSSDDPDLQELGQTLQQGPDQAHH